MDPMKLAELLEAHPETETLLPEGKPGPGSQSILGIVTDTRTLQPGEVFVALVGERLDGHAYLQQAVQAGAAALVVSNRQAGLKFGEQVPVLVVQDTLQAYQDYAAFYRRTHLRTVIGVTGSVGKTSTREMIACALQPSLSVYRTHENYNNQIGVPMTLLATRGACDVSVVELGMDHAGEIAELSRIVRPDLAVITGIGYSHIENLGSQEAIFEAKTEVLEGLKLGGTLLIPAGDPWLRKLIGQEGESFQLAFVAREAASEEQEETGVLGAESLEGLPGPCLVARSVVLDEQGLASFEVYLRKPEGEEIPYLPHRLKLPVAGSHHILNALFGLLCAYLLEQPAERAAQGLADFSVVGNRQKWVEAGGVTLINDSYNAAPESMRASLATLKQLSQRMGGRSIAVLGGIAELGDHAEALHQEVGRALARLDLDLAYLCGPHAAAIARGCQEAGGRCSCRVFADRETLTDHLLPALEDRDIVWIKGSHSFHMEAVCDRIVQQRLEAAEAWN